MCPHVPGLTAKGIVQRHGFSGVCFRWADDFSPSSLLLGVLNSFLRCVRPLCHCWCPPFSDGHVAFLFILLPGLSLLVSALFRWPCSISIHLSPRSLLVSALSAGRVALLFMVCHCWCPPFSVGHVAFLCICLPGQWLLVSAVTGGGRPFPLAHVAFLFICLRGLSLLVSARWPCSISVHLSPRSVTAGVRPFPLTM